MWYSNCTVSDQKALQRVVKTAQYITCVQLPSIKDIHYKHWTITCAHCMFTMCIMLPVFVHLFVLLSHNAICIVYHTYVVYIYIYTFSISILVLYNASSVFIHLHLHLLFTITCTAGLCFCTSNMVLRKHLIVYTYISVYYSIFLYILLFTYYFWLDANCISLDLYL